MLMKLIFTAVVALLPLFWSDAGCCLCRPAGHGGLVLQSEAMSFKWEKLDPVKGLGRVFSAKGLLELLKALIKFFLLLTVAYLLLMLFRARDSQPQRVYPRRSQPACGDHAAPGAAALSATMLLIVMFDVPFELWNHNRQLRMTRQEVRDELKETDGRPEVRQRMRNLQRRCPSAA
jgi:flagellar biosynthetic protein FlhB